MQAEDVALDGQSDDADASVLRQLYPRERYLWQPVFAMWRGKSKQSRQGMIETPQSRQTRQEAQAEAQAECHLQQRQEQVWSQTMQFHEWLCRKKSDPEFRLTRRKEAAMRHKQRQVMTRREQCLQSRSDQPT